MENISNINIKSKEVIQDKSTFADSIWMNGIFLAVNTMISSYL